MSAPTERSALDIVYINQYFHTPAMKGGTRAYEFSRRLVERGHRVNLLTALPPGESLADGSMWSTTVEAGVTVHWCSVPYSHHMGVGDRLRSFGRFAFQAARRARRLPQDVVFATSTPLTIALPGIASARSHRAPMVFEVRDVWPEVPIAMGYLRSPLVRGVASALERLAYRESTSIIALSPDMAESITRRFPHAAVSVVPNSSDAWLFGQDRSVAREAFRRERPWLGDRPLVLYGGAFGPANDVGYLVALAGALREHAPDVRFLLVGEGKERGRIETEARALGVWESSVFVEPPVPKEKMADYVAAADVCASVFADIPALRANSPNKAFDAFAAGRPVVVNNGGWLGEVLEQSGAGLSLPPGDPAGAAVVLADALADPGWLEKAGRAAADLAATRFDRDLLFERFENVLVEAVATRRRRRGM